MTRKLKRLTLLLKCTEGLKPLIPTLETPGTEISLHTDVGAEMARAQVLCCGAETHDWDLLLQCCLQGSVGQRTALGKSFLSHPAEGAEVTTAESASSAGPSPSFGGWISFSRFSSCAPIWNLADLFKNCFVEGIIQKGIIQFSIDHSHQESIKAAWLYQSDRAGMQETSRTQVYEAESHCKLCIPLLPVCAYCYRSCDQWLLQEECKQKRMIKGDTEAPVLVIRPKPGTAAVPRGDNCMGNFCDIDTNSRYSQLNHVTSKQLQAIWDVPSKVCLLP